MVSAATLAFVVSAATPLCVVSAAALLAVEGSAIQVTHFGGWLQGMSRTRAGLLSPCGELCAEIEVPGFLWRSEASPVLKTRAKKT